jgi:hypothetical protein
MKPKSKRPGTKHLKLDCDTLLSTSAFEINLCRYSLAMLRWARQPGCNWEHYTCAFAARAYNRSHLNST